MRNSIKLGAAIAMASAAGTANAVCPAGTADVSGAYGVIGGFTDYCQLAGVYTSPLTLTSDTLWVLEGKVEIGNAITSPAGGTPGTFVITEIGTSSPDATTLTVNAGTTIIGDNAAGSAIDYLVVNRGSDVFMNGTAANPIRMTGQQNLATGAETPQQWGGLYINGYGITNECDVYTTTLGNGPNPGDCERAGEADTGRYGGANDADDSGSISYVTVAYAGNAFDPETDLNGIAFQAVGSGTTVENIQVHANFDDGVEFYGGAVNVKNVVVTDAGDDGFDTTGGWRGNAQFVLITQTGAGNDRAFESDNNKSPNDALPETDGRVANVTVLRDNGDTSDVLKIRRGSSLGLYNVVMAADAGTCFDITDGDGNGNAATAELVSVNHDCATVTDAVDSDTWLANNAGEVHSYPSQLNGYINSGAENASASTDMTAIDAFFTGTSYPGAVASCDNDWTAGWTIPGTLPAIDANACNASLQVPVMGWAGLIALFGGLAGVAGISRRIK